MGLNEKTDDETEDETPDGEEAEEEGVDSEEGEESEEEESEDGEEESEEEGSEEAEEEDSVKLIDTLLQSQLETAQSQADHWKRKHDELSGKVGTRIRRLQDEIRRLRGGKSRRNEREDELDDFDDRDDDRYDDEDDLRSRRRRRQAPAVDPAILKDAVDREVERFGRQFNKHIGPHAKFIENHLMKNADRVRAAQEDGDLEAVKIASRGLLLEGLTKAIEAQMKTDNDRKKASDKKLQGKKKLQQPPGGKREGQRIQAPVDPEKMDEKQIAAAFRKMGRKGF